MRRFGNLSIRRRRLGVEPLEPRALLSAVPLELDVDEYLAGHREHPAVRQGASESIYYVDEFFKADSEFESLTAASAASDDSSGAASGEVGAAVTEVPAYESLPDSYNIFYLDFTGDIVTGTDWNEDYEGRPIHALPFDLDGDTTTYSGKEQAWMDEIWQRVSEDYAPFDINVTTIEPKKSLSRAYRTARIIVTSKEDAAVLGGTGDTWFPDAGGVAYVGGWVTNADAPGWVFPDALPNTAKAIGEAVAHEFGHIVGLSHHGDADSDYYTGHGSGVTGWAPIMGAGYGKNLTQWSNGQYDGASNPRQDDIAVITNRHNRIRVRQDDHGSEPTPLTLHEDGSLYGQGLIEKRTDFDTFTFEHPGGPVNIGVLPAEVGGNLDVGAVLYDANGTIGDYTPEDNVSVQILEELEPGTYYLDVEGVGYSPSGEQGYSSYGSLGAYSISVEFGYQVVANAGGAYTIDEGTTLRLDARQSLGTDERASFGWDLDNDGEYDDASGETVELTWEQLGKLSTPIVDQTTFVVGLEVRNANSTDTDTAVVKINNVAPRLEVEPHTGFAGNYTMISVEAVDIPADPMLFQWNFGDATEVQITGSPTVLHLYLEPGEYSVVVIVGDDEGLVTEENFVITIQAPRAGDTNFDGDVNFADFLILSAHFGETSAVWVQGDFDGDGTVGFSDFLLLSANFDRLPAASLSEMLAAWR